MTALIVYPFFLALWFSLSDGMIGETRHWIGLQNFVYILQDHIFLQTIRNTIIFAVSSVVLKSVFGLGLALLLQRATRWKRFFRGSVLIPFVAPTALTTLRIRVVQYAVGMKVTGLPDATLPAYDASLEIPYVGPS